VTHICQIRSTGLSTVIGRKATSGPPEQGAQDGSPRIVRENGEEDSNWKAGAAVGIAPR
jgi:hypothetical protein